MSMQNVTMVSRSAPALNEQVRLSLVVGLNQNLAGLTDLATAYKQARWNVVGIDFAQLHVVFDQLADQTRDFVDLIAERAVAIGGVARGTIQAVVEHSTLPAFPVEERDEVRLLEELVRRTDVLAADLRGTMDESAAEAATQDIYIEVVRGIEKQRWMLQSYLASRWLGDGREPRAGD
jgi:starvation-inducible DNA-binding protein